MNDRMLIHAGTCFGLCESKGRQGSKGSPFHVCVRAATLALCLVASLSVAAQEETKGESSESDIEAELTAVREDLIKAFNDADLDRLLSHCRTDVIAVWPHGEVAVGHDEVRQVINGLLGSDQPLIESYTTDPTVETRIVLNDGQAVVSSGEFNDEYTLTHPKGAKVRLDSSWTATLVKEDGRWLIASFHMSANAFDNEVITLTTKMLRYWWGGLGAVAGLLLGGLFGMSIGRRRAAATVGA